MLNNHELLIVNSYCIYDVCITFGSNKLLIYHILFVVLLNILEFKSVYVLKELFFYRMLINFVGIGRIIFTWNAFLDFEPRKSQRFCMDGSFLVESDQSCCCVVQQSSFLCDEPYAHHCMWESKKTYLEIIVRSVSLIYACCILGEVVASAITTSFFQKLMCDKLVMSFSFSLTYSVSGLNIA